MINKIKSIKVPLLLKNTFIYAFSDALSKALPFIIFPVVAYYLTAEDFGRVNNFQVLIAVMAPFIGLSTNAFFGTEYHKKGQDIKKLYAQTIYFNFFLFLILAVIVFSFITQISKWSGLDALWIILALVTGLLSASTEIFMARIRMQEKARYFGVFNFSVALFGALLTVLFVVIMKLNWQGRVYSLVITGVVTGLVALFNGIKYIGRIQKPDTAYWKRFLIFGIPLLPHNLSIWIKSGFDKLFITDSIGLAANGVYSFAVNINAIFSILATAFFSAFSPYVYRKLSECSAEDIDISKEGIVRNVYYFLTFYFLLLVAGYYVLHFLVKQFFFVKYGESLQYLPFLLGYNFFNAVYIVLSMFIYYAQKTKFLGIITIATSFLQVILTVTLISTFGVAGAAISALLISMLVAVLIYFYSNKVYPMNWLAFRRAK